MLTSQSYLIHTFKQTHQSSIITNHFTPSKTPSLEYLRPTLIPALLHQLSLLEQTKCLPHTTTTAHNSLNTLLAQAHRRTALFPKSQNRLIPSLSASATHSFSATQPAQPTFCLLCMTLALQLSLLVSERLNKTPATFSNRVHCWEANTDPSLDSFISLLLDTGNFDRGHLSLKSLALGSHQRIPPSSHYPVSLARYHSMSDLKMVMHGKI